MRILHVIPSISPRRGGPSEALRHMVEAQRAYGLHPEIATSDEDGRRPPTRHGTGQVPLHIFPRRLTRFAPVREYAFCPSFGPWLRDWLPRYDLLHVHALFSHLPTMAMQSARRAGVPYISRPLGQLGFWPLRQSAAKKAVYLRLVERQNLDGAAALHFTSAVERDEAAALRLQAPAFVLPHGVALPPLLPNAARNLRTQLKLDPACRVVLFLGRLHAKKGLDLLLRAISFRPVPRLVLLVAGEGPERSPLERLARELGLASQVRWLGRVEGPLKQVCLQGADLFTLTSHHENFGLAVLEALAAGTPALVSPQVALAREIERERLGQVAPLDPAGIARVLACSLLGAPILDRPARRRYVEKTYNWPAHAAALARLYVQVVKRSLVPEVHRP